MLRVYYRYNRLFPISVYESSGNANCSKNIDNFVLPKSFDHFIAKQLNFGNFKKTKTLQTKDLSIGAIGIDIIL